MQPVAVDAGWRIERATISVSLAVAAAGSAALAWTMANATYDTFAGVLVAVVLTAVSLALGPRLARSEPDPRVARLLRAAPLLKLASTIVRFSVVYVVYDGVADAGVYHAEGARLAESYRLGEFAVDLGRPFIGTGAVRAITGLIYTITGPSQLAGFFVFSWLGFWGLYWCYRAFTIAIPEGNRLRYARLVLLLPSLLFWPSSIGKEAWIIAGLGLFAVGAARTLTHTRRGIPQAGIGLVMVGIIRPHVAAIAGVALMVAYATRRRPAGRSLLAPVGKLLAVGTLAVVVAFLVGQASEVVGLDSYNLDAVQEALASTTDRTSTGGAVIENKDTDLDPSRFPSAIVGVLFRPFPWEAHNIQSLVASLEGVLLLVLFVVGWRRLLGALRTLLESPYVVLSVIFTLVFVYAFSSFANFGILTRQRVQVLPFALVLVCVPPFVGGRRDWRRLLGRDAADVSDAEGAATDPAHVGPR